MRRRLDTIEKIVLGVIGAIFGAAILAGIIVALLVNAAFGQPYTDSPQHRHEHSDEVITGATARFYETWMRPDMPYSSCCNRNDCAPVGGVRIEHGKLQAMRKKDGVWLTIPDSKIERNRESPTPEGHMCSIGTSVLCFVSGAGG